MKYKYLNSDGDLPNDLDWDADVEVVPDGDNTNPDAHQNPKPGMGAGLYYDSPHFRELVEQGGNYVYHDRMDGLFLVGYAFSDCMVDDQDRVIVKGLLHPTTESIKGDYHTDESQVIASVVLRIKMKDQRTLEATGNTGKKTAKTVRKNQQARPNPLNCNFPIPQNFSGPTQVSASTTCKITRQARRHNGRQRFFDRPQPDFQG